MGQLWDLMGFGDFIVMKNGMCHRTHMMILCRNVVSGFRGDEHCFMVSGWAEWLVNNNSSGWWLTYPFEKYEFVSWDDEIPNMMGKIIQSCSSHRQPELY
jgi:hypothetical protein